MHKAEEYSMIRSFILGGDGFKKKDFWESLKKNILAFWKCYFVKHYYFYFISPYIPQYAIFGVGGGGDFDISPGPNHEINIFINFII